MSVVGRKDNRRRVTHVIRSTKRGRHIECLVCGAVSYYQQDIDEEYCGLCQQGHPIQEKINGR